MDRHDIRIDRIVRSCGDLALERFAVGAFEMPQRFGTDLGNLRVMVAFGFDFIRAFRLDAGKFELFGENLRQFFHGEIDFEDVRARRVAGLASAVVVNVPRGQWRADFTVALSNLGKTYNPAQDGGGVAAVPEPGSLALAALGGGGLMVRRRRRRMA